MMLPIIANNTNMLLIPYGEAVPLRAISGLFIPPQASVSPSLDSLREGQT